MSRGDRHLELKTKTARLWEFCPRGKPVSRWRFELFQYRQVLVQLRQGESDREIARSRLMGGRKVSAFREVAAAQGWLAPEAPLPDDATVRAAIGQAHRASSTICAIECYRAQVERWRWGCRHSRSAPA